MTPRIEHAEVNLFWPLFGAGAGTVIAAISRSNIFNLTVCTALVCTVTQVAVSKLNEIANDRADSKKLPHEKKYTALCIETLGIGAATLTLFTLGVLDIRLVALSVLLAMIKIAIDLK